MAGEGEVGYGWVRYASGTALRAFHLREKARAALAATRDFPQQPGGYRHGFPGRPLVTAPGYFSRS